MQRTDTQRLACEHRGELPSGDLGHWREGELGRLDAAAERRHLVRVRVRVRVRLRLRVRVRVRVRVRPRGTACSRCRCSRRAARTWSEG